MAMLDPEKASDEEEYDFRSHSTARSRPSQRGYTTGATGHEPSSDSTLDRSLSRMRTGKSSTFSTPGTEPIIARIRTRKPLEPFDHPLAKNQTAEDCLVDFKGPNDPYNPLNWPTKKKVISTALYGFTTMGSTWASSVFAPAVPAVGKHFGVSSEVSILGVALLLFGFGLGPLLWAPLSEVYGRKPAVLIPFFISGCFAFGTGAAKDIQTVMITRFFAGFFGSAPVTNSGGVLGDIFTPEHRGVALIGYALAIVGGPCLGPIAGSAIVTSHLGWRWTEYITGIYIMFILALDVLILDESFAPVLLQTKARRLRHATGNWALHAKHEEWDVTLSELAHKYLVVPIKVLRTPIGLAMALYASFTYALLYGSLAAFPIIFQEIRGWSPVVGSLAFLALLLGILIAAGLNYFNQKYYVRKYHANNNRAVPEARLPPMMIGSLFFAAGLFIMAWTADPSIFWIVPLIGAVFMGLGFFAIFQAALNYLIDTFQKNAASAVAANTFLRSCFAGGFPIFIGPLVHSGLGIGWALSIWGFLAVILIPVPYILFAKGKVIRGRSELSRQSL